MTKRGSHLTMMQFNSLIDDAGRFRCPWCGRFRRVMDFPKQVSHATAEDRSFHVDWAPACRECIERRKDKQWR